MADKHETGEDKTLKTTLAFWSSCFRRALGKALKGYALIRVINSMLGVVIAVWIVGYLPTLIQLSGNATFKTFVLAIQSDTSGTLAKIAVALLLIQFAWGLVKAPFEIYNEMIAKGKMRFLENEKTMDVLRQEINIFKGDAYLPLHCDAHIDLRKMSYSHGTTYTESHYIVVVDVSNPSHHAMSDNVIVETQSWRVGNTDKEIPRRDWVKQGPFVINAQDYVSLNVVAIREEAGTFSGNIFSSGGYDTHSMHSISNDSSGSPQLYEPVGFTVSVLAAGRQNSVHKFIVHINTQHRDAVTVTKIC